MNEAEEGNDNPITTKLAAVVGLIQSNFKDSGAKNPISIQSLLTILASNGIELSRRDLESMLDEPPLSNLIANIEGNDVIFVDQDEEDQGDAIDADQSSETLKQMATRAATKPDELQ